VDEMHFTVPGMTCSHCVTAVRDAVGKVPGVDTVLVDLDTKTVVVKGAGLDRQLLSAAVDNAGYTLVK
jgi:copper chaperone CopZ